MTGWTAAAMVSQEGRIAIVTGTGGLGYEIALALARVGADVVLAGRNAQKGAASVARIMAAAPRARIRFEQLDLASLESVTAFAERFSRVHAALDLLVNNAGVMALPLRRVTADGFEMQFGTNHLGHFALTAHLLDALRRGAAPRVVNVSSGVANFGAMRFDDLQAEHSYNPTRAYAQSKLANLLFTFELQRRSDAGKWGLMSNAAHPGYATTDLIENGPGASFLTTLLGPIVGQSPADGALPILFAATSPEAKPAAYYGPGRLFGMKGAPAKAPIPRRAHDAAAAAQLWELSEKLTRTSFAAATI